MTQKAYWRGFSAWAAGPVRPPQAIRERAQDAIIDTIACILGARDAPAARAAAAIAGPTRADRAMTLAAAGHAIVCDDDYGGERLLLSRLKADYKNRPGVVERPPALE